MPSCRRAVARRSTKEHSHSNRATKPLGLHLIPPSSSRSAAHALCVCLRATISIHHLNPVPENNLSQQGPGQFSRPAWHANHDGIPPRALLRQAPPDPGGQASFGQGPTRPHYRALATLGLTSAGASDPDAIQLPTSADSARTRNSPLLARPLDVHPQPLAHRPTRNPV